jgi:hypothetical protein
MSERLFAISDGWGSYCHLFAGSSALRNSQNTSTSSAVSFDRRPLDDNTMSEFTKDLNFDPKNILDSPEQITKEQKEERRRRQKAAQKKYDKERYDKERRGKVAKSIKTPLIKTPAPPPRMMTSMTASRNLLTPVDVLKVRTEMKLRHDAQDDESNLAEDKMELEMFAEGFNKVLDKQHKRRDDRKSKSAAEFGAHLQEYSEVAASVGTPLRLGSSPMPKLKLPPKTPVRSKASARKKVKSVPAPVPSLEMDLPQLLAAKASRDLVKRVFTMGQLPGELGFAVPYEDEPMAPKVKVLSKLNYDHLALKLQYLLRENPGHNIYLYNQMERSGDSASAMQYGVLQVLLAKGVPPPFLMEIELQSVKKFEDLQLAWVPVVDLKYGGKTSKELGDLSEYCEGRVFCLAYVGRKIRNPSEDIRNSFNMVRT